MIKQKEQKFTKIISEIIKIMVSEGITINEMEYILDEAKYKIKDLIPSVNRNI